MKYGMEDSFLEKFYYINMRQQEFIKGRLKTIKLGITQARTIHFIGLNPGTIQKDLANYLGMQHASVTNLLKNLEQNGYITRKIPEDNERQKNLYLTKKGVEDAQKVQEIFYDLEGKIGENISLTEKNQLMETLKKVDTTLGTV
ncbi:MarR family winged helix-turn-helix transcriptional regulator [Enterococcus hermanniensis]|nr:MarR family transcriptional regulator [Enterococcus hermanniensis]